VSDDVLVHYLRQQIDTDAAQDAPDASYTDYIAPQDYSAQQERMWELWRRANAERLATQAWAIGSLNALVWKIPQGAEKQPPPLAGGTLVA